MKFRRLKDVLAGRLMLAAAVFSGMLVFIIAAGLYLRAKPILEVKSCMIFCSEAHGFLFRVSSASILSFSGLCM